MHDPDRRAKPTDSGHNLMRQSRLTQGSMTDENGRFLEVVSAPLPLGR
jgi:hypothetical protein